MKLLTCFCFLLLICSCLSSLPKRYCDSKNKDEIQNCIKAAGENEFKEMCDVAKECLTEHFPGLEVGTLYEEVCEKIDTEKGNEFQSCFDSGVEKHGSLDGIIKKCMDDHA